MIPFKFLNDRYYTPVLSGYTSNDEFIANKKIWENNELPSWDPYDASHSLLHDDLWKWFLGYTSMSYDIPFNYETHAEEYFDDDGIITHPSIAKYVNNIRAKNYGPQPHYSYEKDRDRLNGGMEHNERMYALKEDLTTFTSGEIWSMRIKEASGIAYTKNEWVYRPIWPSYTRYEVNGTVAPEFDFLLHEGYRYLKTLYPDHPDYELLLTTNEINDEYNQIAAFIDFKINSPFYDWLSTQLDYGKEIKDSDLYHHQRQEALKLKYRNLIQHTFRRKLYGAKAGYWMFGSEALMHTAIYPVAEYLPIKPRKTSESESFLYGKYHKNTYVGEYSSGIVSGIFEGTFDGIISGNVTPEGEVLSGTYGIDSNKKLNGEIYAEVSGIISGYLIGLRDSKWLTPEEATKVIYNTDNNNDYRWYRKLFTAPDLFKEKVINHNDTLYTHPYRLIDFSNNSYDIKNRWVPPVKIFATAYPNPLSPYDIYEYPVERDSNIPLTMQEDFYEGQKIWIGQKELDQDLKTPSYLNAMYYEDSYQVIAELDYDENNLLDLANTSVYTKTLEDTISHAQVTAPVASIYSTFDVYDSMKESMKKAIISGYDLSNYHKESGKENFLNHFSGLQYSISGTSYLYEQTKRVEVDAALDIHQNGSIFLSAEQFLTLYYDNLNLGVDRNNILLPFINYFDTGINEKDGIIREEDLLVKNHMHTSESDRTVTSISEICGLNGGKLTIKLDHHYIPNSVYESIINSNYSEPRYGLILQLSLNNSDSYGKKVVIFGRPEFIFVKPQDTKWDGYQLLDTIIYTISSIPRIKSNNELLLLYKDFSGTAIQKATDLAILFGDGDDLDEENFYKKYHVNEIRKIVENFTNFKNNINVIYKKFDAENKTRKNLNEIITIIHEMYNYPDYDDPDTKYEILTSYLKSFNTDLDNTLIVYPDKEKFDLLIQSLKETLEKNQQEFYNDLIEYRFPIKDNVEGMRTQLEIIKPKVPQIYDIINNVEKGDGIYEVLYEDYELFYYHFNTFVEYFYYSSGQGGLQEKIQKLYPNFKTYADALLHSIRVQPTIFEIKRILGALKEEVKYIFGFIDHAQEPPYPILKGKNFTDLEKNIEIYKDFYKDLPEYETVVKTVDTMQHHVYNVIKAVNPYIFDEPADNLYNTVEKFREPYIQDPEIYVPYLEEFMKEIDKYHEIFKKDLVDMPVLIEGYKVRFPIQANMNEFYIRLEKFIEAFDDELAFWEETVGFSDTILRDHYRYENDLRTFHYTDISDFVHELKRQLTEKYNLFRNTVDIKSINDETFDNERVLMINIFNEYNTFYNNHLKYMISTDLDREYYSILIREDLEKDQRNALSSIKNLDKKIDEYLSNRGLLLKPLPDDIYLSTIPDKNYSYSLLKDQDLYLGIVKLKLDNYNTFIDYEFVKDYGNKGIMIDFHPGTVVTAQLVHNSENTNPSVLQFSPTEKYKNEYSITELNPDNIEQTEYYISLNTDIININKGYLTNNENNKRKFSYCNNEWLELFLPESAKYNIEGELQKRYEVEIRSILKKDSTKIEFIDEESKKRINALTTGDQIIGPNIEDDTFVEFIDLFNNTIIINKPSNITGDLVLTYLTRFNLYPSEFESNNFFDYRIELAHSGKKDRRDEPLLAKNNSILENGVIGSAVYPNISQNFINGYIDILKYRDDLTTNLRNQIPYSSVFNDIVRNIHNDNQDLMHAYTLPSFINYKGDAYFEVNAHRMYDNNHIMVKEILDYFQGYLDELSRASDNINIGVNIIATTDTSRTISPIVGAEYSDPNINLRFITTDQWSDQSIPTYIELGIGCLEDLFSPKDEEEPQNQTSQDKSYYNYDVYDSHRIVEGAVNLNLFDNDDYTTYEQLQKEGITLENDGGALYGGYGSESTLDAPINAYEHVDIPIIKYKLGEYEIQKNITFENYLDPLQKFTTVQFSVIKQMFKNLQIEGKSITQITKNFLNLGILRYPSSTYHSIINFGPNNEDYKLFPEKDLKVVVFRGEWLPNTKVVNNKNTINYPEPEVGLSNIYYYYIATTVAFSSIIDPQDGSTSKTFKSGSILIWNNENKIWEIKDFIFSGLLGRSPRPTLDFIDKEYAQSLSSPVITLPQVLPGFHNGKEISLKMSLLSKLLSYSGIFYNIDTERLYELSNEDYNLLFKKLCGDDVPLDTLDIEYTNNYLNITDPERKINGEFVLEDSERNRFNLYKNILPQFKKSSIYWIYSTEFDEGSTASFYNTLNGIVESPKIFALIFIEDTFIIYLVDSTKGFYLLDHSNKLGINQNEYRFFTGYYGKTINKLLPYEKIADYQNTIQLAYDNIIPGSVDIKLKLLPNFTVSGYLYNNDILDKSNLNSYNITEDNIYFDSANNCLYSYNDNKKIKFSIEQENNKYFKNVLYLYANYTTELVTEGSEIVERGKLSAIPTLAFDTPYTSLKDRLLEIEKINVRSRYNTNLESTQFSNYLIMSGIINGIYFNDNVSGYSDPYLSIGYRYDREPKNTGNRLSYSTELNKILPLRYNTETQVNDKYQKSSITFDENNIAFWESTSGYFLNSPLIQHSEVFSDTVSDPDLTAFKYYKNTLILEGQINVTDPSYIDFSNNPKLGDALSKVSTNNRIVSIVGLNNLQNRSYTKFKVLHRDRNTDVVSDMSIDIRALDYNNSYLVGADNKGYFVHHCTDLNNLGIVQNDTDDIDADNIQYYKIEAFKFNYNSNSGETYGPFEEVKSLAYDEANQRWIISLSNSKTDLYNIFSITVNELGNGVIESYITPIYNKAGYDVNTYQKISILDEDFGDVRYNTSANVFSRDIALVRDVVINSAINIEEEPEFKLIPEKRGLDKSDTRPSLPNLVLNDVTRFNGVAISTSQTLDVVDLVNPNTNKIIDYKIVTFLLSKQASSPASSNISIGIKTDEYPSNETVKKIWTYNYNTGMWEVSRNVKTFSNFIEDFDAKGQYVPITLYVVNEDWVYNNPNSEFILRDLPKKPTMNTFAIIVGTATQATAPSAVANKHKVTLQATVNGGGIFEIYEYRVTTPAKISLDYNSGYLEEPYAVTVNASNTLPVENKREQLLSNRWSAYYGKYQVILTGNTLFMKSPTRTIVEEVNDPGTISSGWTYTAETTAEYHWKRAELPSIADVTYALFNEMTLDQAYSLVKNEYDSLLGIFGNMEKEEQFKNLDPLVDKAYKALRAFLDRSAPLKISTEEELPVNIELDGVEFFQTEHGLIPYFSGDIEKRTQRWQSTIDSKYELGDKIDVYLKRQNYLRYLADYYYVILGTRRFDHFYTEDGIKDITLTSKALIIRTKYDDILSLDSQYFSTRKDIENYHNWTISNIDENYTTTSNDITYLDRIIGVDRDGTDAFVNVPLMPTQKPSKAFKLLNSYIENNISIYCGYIEGNSRFSEIYTSYNPGVEPEDVNSVEHETWERNRGNQEDLLTLFPNNSSLLTDGAPTFFSTKYPVIYYSTDNKNFSKVAIPTTDFITDISSYTPTIGSLEAYSIVKENTELKIYIRDESGATKGYTSFSVATFSNTFTLTHNANVELNITDLARLTSQEVKNGFLNAQNMILYGDLDSITQEYTSTGPRFLLSQQYRPDVNEARVSLKEDMAIRFTPAPSPAIAPELLNVLVAIDTTYSVQDQSRYLAFKQEYVDTAKGVLKVDEYVEVKDLGNANRMYSPRECLLVRPASDIDMSHLYPREIPPKTGMPAISEDLDHVVYIYGDSFEDENGETIYPYIEATNSEGYFVNLCDINGGFLLERDITSLSQVVTLQQVIENSLPLDRLAKAGTVRADYNPVIRDDYLSDLLNSIDNKTIRYISFDSANPQLWINIEDIPLLYSYLEGKFLVDGKFKTKNGFDYDLVKGEEYYKETQDEALKLSRFEAKKDFDKNRYLYRWPCKSKKNPATGEVLRDPVTQDILFEEPSKDDLAELFYVDTSNSESTSDIESSQIDFIDARAFIEEREGIFDKTGSNYFNNRFDWYKINDTYYIVDTKTNTLMMRHYKTIRNNYNVPFLFQNGIQIFTNRNFLINREEAPDQLVSPNLNYPITGMYLPHGGYGGYLNNLSWVERPDELDYYAWDHTKFLVNYYNELIYLSDYRGNKLSLKHGLFPLEPGKEITINYNNITYEGLNVYHISDASIIIDKEDADNSITAQVTRALSETKFTYNLYKFKPTPFTLYSPKDTVWFNHRYGVYSTDPEYAESGKPTSIPSGGINKLARIRLIKAGITSNEDIKSWKIVGWDDKPPVLLAVAGDEKTEIKSKTENNIDYNYLFNFNVPLAGEPPDSIEWLTYTYWNDSNKEQEGTEIPFVKGNELKLVITDKYDQIQEIKFFINSVDKEPCRILDISEIYTYDNNFVLNNQISLTIDSFSIYSLSDDINYDGFADEIYEDTIIPQDSTINCVPDRINRPSLLEMNKIDSTYRETVVSISPNNMVLSDKLSYANNLKITLDIRELELQLLSLKDWTNKPVNEVSNFEEEFKLKLYSGDRFVGNKFVPSYDYYEINSEPNILATIDKVSILKPIYQKIGKENEIWDSYLELENGDYVFLQDSDDRKYSFKNRVLVDGIYGLVLVKVPLYESFRDLLDKLEYIIEYKDNKQKLVNSITVDGINFNTFIEIANDNSYIILEKLLNLNTANSNYLRIKILPIQTITANLKTANNPKYIWEVTQQELVEFGMDRVWINKNSYPESPILLNNIMYNSENIPYYYENRWKNKDNFNIYSCDETGRYVKFVPSGRVLDTEVLGNELGDLRQDVYGIVDPRYNLLEPIYVSSLDWFLADFYVKGQESNPFILELQISEIVKDNKFKSIIRVTRKVKQNNIIVDKEITDEYVLRSNINIKYIPSEDYNSIVQDTEVPIIDHKNGVLSFTVIEPTQKYKENMNLSLYGINYYNPYYFFESREYSKVWTNFTQINNNMNLTFDINSFEDYLDKKNKDIAIRSITEMGIFNQTGKLIAYCHHPRVEYRTDSQHISYSLIIRE